MFGFTNVDMFSFKEFILALEFIMSRDNFKYFLY